jgi:hypothetical protein
MGVIYPARVDLPLESGPTARKGEILPGLQIGPLDLARGVFWVGHPKPMRVDRNVKCAVEEPIEVQPWLFEERFLPFQRAIGII